MDEQVENAYFNWLCSKVINVKLTDPNQTYWKLFKQLHGTEFTWVHRMDENRAADGMDLRRDFLALSGGVDSPEWRDIPCSVLEMLIAFARRAEHMTDIPYQEWFWRFLDNLDLKDETEVSDAANFDPQDIDSYLQIWMNRQYGENGDGGLFPLKNPHENQHNVELWYQFCRYVAEHDDELP